MSIDRILRMALWAFGAMTLIALGGLVAALVRFAERVL